MVSEEEAMLFFPLIQMMMSKQRELLGDMRARKLAAAGSLVPPVCTGSSGAARAVAAPVLIICLAFSYLN